MTEPLFETTIIFDEGKLKECPYSENQINDWLDKLFAVGGLERDGNTFKYATLARVGGVMSTLFKCEWFMKIVKEWTLVARDGEKIVCEENVLASKALRKKYLNQYGL